jgi:hypothetical protein
MFNAIISNCVRSGRTEQREGSLYIEIAMASKYFLIIVHLL